MRVHEGSKKSAAREGIHTRTPAVRHRRRWTRDQKRLLVEQWKQSGTSRLAFCRKHQIAYGSFLYWSKDVAARDRGGFLEVRVSPTVSANKSCDAPIPAFGMAEIVAPSGWKVRLSPGFDHAQIEAILSLLPPC